MQAVLDAVFPIFALILAGFVCARKNLLPPASVEVLNRFVVWLALPALLFKAMAEVKAAQLDHPGFLAAHGGATILAFTVPFLVDRKGGKSMLDRSIEALAASYGNTAFMGIPLCLAAFGPAGLLPAVISTMITVFALFAAAIMLVEFALQERRSLRGAGMSVTLALARNPLVAAPVAGAAVAVLGLRLPLAVDRLASLIGAAASPCALVTIGLFLARKQTGGERTGGDWPAIIRLVLLKLVALPAATALVAYGLLGMRGFWAQAAVLLSAMPTGTGPFMVAQLYDREPGIVSRVILISTVLSIVTISGLVAWIGQPQ